jgi:RNA polymerase sigma-70 factor (ECF subfamily)
MGSAWRPAFEGGRQAWPTAELTFDTFLAHAERVVGQRPEPGTHTQELFLACACAAGDRVALSLLEEKYLIPARGSLLRIDSRPDFIDDVMQELRTKLLVGARPRIGDYAGRGPLLAWIRVSATRTAIDLRRSAKPNPGLEGTDVDGLPMADLGAEVQLLRQAYREAFKEALGAALQALSPRDRNLLRRHLVDQQTLDEIAAPYGVHPATIARRLAALREQIAESIRLQLATGHREAGGSSSLESLAYAIRSEVHLSLAALLAGNQTSPDDSTPARLVPET